MEQNKTDELLNEIFKMKRFSGTVVVKVVGKKEDSGLYKLEVLQGTKFVPDGFTLYTSASELKYATRVTGSFQQ